MSIWKCYHALYFLINQQHFRKSKSSFAALLVFTGAQGIEIEKIFKLGLIGPLPKLGLVGVGPGQSHLTKYHCPISIWHILVISIPPWRHWRWRTFFFFRIGIRSNLDDINLSTCSRGNTNYGWIAPGNFLLLFDCLFDYYGSLWSLHFWVWFIKFWSFRFLSSNAGSTYIKIAAFLCFKSDLEQTQMACMISLSVLHCSVVAYPDICCWCCINYLSFLLLFKILDLQLISWAVLNCILRLCWMYFLFDVFVWEQLGLDLPFLCISGPR